MPEQLPQAHVADRSGVLPKCCLCGPAEWLDHLQSPLARPAAHGVYKFSETVQTTPRQNDR
jgi:hypothetical protein